VERGLDRQRPADASIGMVLIGTSPHKDGLVRLLQTCPSLSQLPLAIDTRDYTDVPPAQSPASLGLTLPPLFSINVVNSVIDTVSVPAMAAFFANISPVYPIFVERRDLRGV